MKMAGRASYVLPIGILLVSMCHGASIADWTRELTRNINDQVQQLQTQIHENVQASLRSTFAQVDETLRNLPRDENGRLITNNGNIITVNSGGGMSRTIVSGHDPNGEPYIRDIQERVTGNELYHNEISYNPKTNITERIRWKLDLATPGAKPVVITDDD